MPRWLKVLLIVVAVAVAVLVVVAIFLAKHEMGTKLKLSDKESVYYGGEANEADAQRLGAALKETGYFSGERTVDVLLRREGGQTRVSFVVQDGSWDKPDIAAQFQVLGAGLKSAVGGQSYTLRLVDDALNVKREFKID